MGSLHCKMKFFLVLLCTSLLYQGWTKFVAPNKTTGDYLPVRKRGIKHYLIKTADNDDYGEYDDLEFSAPNKTSGDYGQNEDICRSTCNSYTDCQPSCKSCRKYDLTTDRYCDRSENCPRLCVPQKPNCQENCQSDADCAGGTCPKCREIRTPERTCGRGEVCKQCVAPTCTASSCSSDRDCQRNQGGGALEECTYCLLVASGGRDCDISLTGICPVHSECVRQNDPRRLISLG